jgi:uncharacterized protein
MDVATVIGPARRMLLRVGATSCSAYHARPWPPAEMPMWYVILGRDAPDSLARRLDSRPAHLERLNALRDAGRLLLAGPMPAIEAEDPGPAGFVGSLIVAEFASAADARAWVDADPYSTAGVFREIEIQPFRRVLP